MNKQIFRFFLVVTIIFSAFSVSAAITVEDNSYFYSYYYSEFFGDSSETFTNSQNISSNGATTTISGARSSSSGSDTFDNY